MKKIKFKKNENITCEALGSFGYIYFEFVKKNFGFGQLSVSKREDGFNCMNEYMGKKTCTDFMTNFLLSHIIDKTFSVNKIEGAWEKLSAEVDFYEKETLEFRVKYLARNDRRNKDNAEKHLKSSNVLNNIFFEMVYPENVKKSGSKITYTLKSNTVGSDNFMSLVIDCKKVPAFKGFSFLDDKEIDVNPPDLEFLDVQNEYGMTDISFKLLLSFLLSKEKQKEFGFKLQDFVESLTYYNVSGNKLPDSVIEMPKSRLKAIDLRFEYRKENCFYMNIKDGGNSHFLKMNYHDIKDDEGNVLTTYHTLDFDCEPKLVYEAFAKIIIEMKLEDVR